MVRRVGFWPRTVIVLVKPVLFAMTKRTWSGMENVPRKGGVIIVANHMSEIDPLVVAHYVVDAGRWPRFLAKSSLFHVPVLGSLLRAVHQTPVYRGSVDAAVATINAGNALIIYPEGTTPKEGDLWPRRGKTGIARLVIATDAPVVPVVTWGAQQIFDPRERTLHLKPRRPISVVAGPPIDLAKWRGAEPTRENLYAITDEIMEVIRSMVGELLGEVPPEAPSSGPKTLANARRQAASSAAASVSGTGATSTATSAAATPAVDARAVDARAGEAGADEAGDAVTGAEAAGLAAGADAAVGTEPAGAE